MILEELQAKLPPQFQPWIATYGPAFAAMTTAEFMAWLQLLTKGDVRKAYADLLTKLPGGSWKDEWAKMDAELYADNQDNAASITLQKQALVDVLKICATIGLAFFGF